MSKPTWFPELGLGDYLRHVPSGALGIGVFLFGRGEHTSVTLDLIADNLVLMSGASVVLGTLIYGVHRGIVNVAIEWARFRLFTDGGAWVMPKKVERRLLDHWMHKSGGSRVKQVEYLVRWADLIHFTYTGSLALLLGGLAGGAASEGESWSPVIWVAWAVALVVFGAGFVNDCRRHRVEGSLYAEWWGLECRRGTGSGGR